MKTPKNKNVALSLLLAMQAEKTHAPKRLYESVKRITKGLPKSRAKELRIAAAQLDLIHEKMNLHTNKILASHGDFLAAQEIFSTYVFSLLGDLLGHPTGILGFANQYGLYQGLEANRAELSAAKNHIMRLLFPGLLASSKKNGLKRAKSGTHT